MKYIYPKQYNLSDFRFTETKHCFKINYIDSCVTIFGIIIELKDIRIVKKMNNYEIELKEKDKIFAYDQLLFENVPNYKRFMNKNNISINGKKINQYYKEKKKDVFLNIGYVKKMGFLNVPILSIL